MEFNQVPHKVRSFVEVFELSKSKFVDNNLFKFIYFCLSYLTFLQFFFICKSTILHQFFTFYLCFLWIRLTIHTTIIIKKSLFILNTFAISFIIAFLMYFSLISSFLQNLRVLYFSWWSSFCFREIVFSFLELQQKHVIPQS